MNSMSKCNCNNKAPIQEQKCDCDNLCKHPIPGEALLRCNNGNFSPVNITFPEGALTVTLNQPIASVTIDTTCLRCPNLLIDFAGVLTVTPISAAAISTLTFTLFRICKRSRARQAVTTFSFNLSQTIGFPESDTLKFEFSPCDDLCKDCCTYILELTSITNITPGVINFSINGTLCALAVESPHKEI